MAPESDTPPNNSKASSIPVEFEIFVNADGSVTFADLEEHAIAIARELDPDCQLACDVPALHLDESSIGTSE